MSEKYLKDTAEIPDSWNQSFLPQINPWKGTELPVLILTDELPPLPLPTGSQDALTALTSGEFELLPGDRLGFTPDQESIELAYNEVRRQLDKNGIFLPDYFNGEPADADGLTEAIIENISDELEIGKSCLHTIASSVALITRKMHDLGAHQPDTLSDDNILKVIEENFCGLQEMTAAFSATVAASINKTGQKLSDFFKTIERKKTEKDDELLQNLLFQLGQDGLLDSTITFFQQFLDLEPKNSIYNQRISESKAAVLKFRNGLNKYFSSECPSENPEYLLSDSYVLADAAADLAHVAKERTGTLHSLNEKMHLKMVVGQAIGLLIEEYFSQLKTWPTLKEVACWVREFVMRNETSADFHKFYHAIRACGMDTKPDSLAIILQNELTALRVAFFFHRTSQPQY